MGKIKQVIMGDIEAEGIARKKATVKREQKKIAKKGDVTEKPVIASHEVAKQSPDVSKKIASSAKLPRNDKNIRGKKYQDVVKLVDKSKVYSPNDAVALVKKTSFSKFDGTVEVHFNVTEVGLRGSVALPHGTGKQVRVKIADEALITDLEKRGPAAIDFDILVANSSLMPRLAKVAKILGPRGLMPNPKTGTIGENVEGLAQSLAKGQIQFKTESAFPIIHQIIGKTSFEDKKLVENLAAFIKAIGKDKIKSCFVKATMGPAIRVQI